MTVCRNDKARILEAFLEKAISKNQMVMLLTEGISIPPIPWIFEDKENQTKDSEKREILCRVFGITFSKIEWI